MSTFLQEGVAFDTDKKRVLQSADEAGGDISREGQRVAPDKPLNRGDGSGEDGDEDQGEGGLAS